MSFDSYVEYCGDQRFLDVDAIGRTFRDAGGSYHGDGSEFITAINGVEYVDDAAVRAAARRSAEDAECSRRAEEGLLKILAQQAQPKATLYFDLDRTVVWFPEQGDVSGCHLLHMHGKNCPYCFEPVTVGPFTYQTEAYVKVMDNYRLPMFPCPVCNWIAMEDMDAETLNRKNSVLNALRSNRWRRECYAIPKPQMPSAETPKTSVDGRKYTTPDISSKEAIEKYHSDHCIRTMRVEEYSFKIVGQLVKFYATVNTEEEIELGKLVYIDASLAIGRIQSGLRSGQTMEQEYAGNHKMQMVMPEQELDCTCDGRRRYRLRCSFLARTIDFSPVVGEKYCAYFEFSGVPSLCSEKILLTVCEAKDK